MEEIKKALVDEIHKPARRNYPRRKVEIRGLDETWQADLVVMESHSRENKGYKYILTVIDNFSKFAWAKALKNKTGKAVTAALKSIFESGRAPKNLHVDQGTEFYNKECKDMLKSKNINLYSTFSNLKASIVERFNRTLKTKMWKLFSNRGSYKWIDILPDLISEYNNSIHRTIKMKPKDVNFENEYIVKRNFDYSNIKNFIPSKFKVGDKVRISKTKHIFEKGYTPNWTMEVFTIEKVRPTLPITYKLKDYQNESIAGGFYEHELLKTNYPEDYLIERVIQKKGDKIKVKWLGFDESHNSWINNTEITKKN